MVKVNENRPVAIQVSGVKKMYRLGQIGGGTLQADLQSWWARVRGKEDPNTKIGEGERIKGQTFMALNGINLTIYQGEAVGIIGGNGAGKSTLLKLLSKVTAPTEGEIDIYGRIASMLEVGTGFNGELTGRENVYMNGAILGMTKQEIDAKMEQIIEFSEVREFIDTPVKRYSSGMFVKLAFSVAAHLDSEIMIMDEVLAVGDMAFQKKCLTKMREAAKQDGRTVLYVSHNMNTIRQLCDRCIVLDKGRVKFEGSVEEAISIYLNNDFVVSGVNIDLNQLEHHGKECTEKIKLLHLILPNKIMPIYNANEILEIKLKIEVLDPQENVAIRMSFQSSTDSPIGSVWSNIEDFIEPGIKTISISFSLDMIPKGEFAVSIGLHKVLKGGGFIPIDHITRAFRIEIMQNNDENAIIWPSEYWGYVRFPDCTLKIGD